MGITIMDMEFFRNGDFKLHDCLDALNRKAILKTIKNDIGLLLNPIEENDKIKIMWDRQTDRTIIKSKNKNGVNYCYLDDETDRISEIMQTKGLWKKVNLLIYSADGIAIDSVTILHYGIDLNMNLLKIE